MIRQQIWTLWLILLHKIENALALNNQYFKIMNSSKTRLPFSSSVFWVGRYDVSFSSHLFLLLQYPFSSFPFFGCFLLFSRSMSVRNVYLHVQHEFMHNNLARKFTNGTEMKLCGQSKQKSRKEKFYFRAQQKWLTVWFSSSSLRSSSEQLSPSSPFPLGTAVLTDGGPQVKTRYSFLLLEL